MKLPEFNDAIIDSKKISEYSLSPNHPRGKHKAHLFKTKLDLDQEDSERLIRAIRRALNSHEAIIGKRDQFGQRYIVDFNMKTVDDPVFVRTVWIIETNKTKPKLVSCYIR